MISELSTSRDVIWPLFMNLLVDNFSLFIITCIYLSKTFLATGTCLDFLGHSVDFVLGVFVGVSDLMVLILILMEESGGYFSEMILISCGSELIWDFKKKNFEVMVQLTNDVAWKKKLFIISSRSFFFFSLNEIMDMAKLTLYHKS